MHAMDSVGRFSSKAERYARYRWGFAPEAIQAIFDNTGLQPQAVAADIGAGTGLLTRELVGKVAGLYAIEPNEHMLEIARQILKPYPSVICIEARSEATTLPGQSVDLITVGQAIHWFEPHATLKEFQRILKPDGWLAILFHIHIDEVLYKAMQAVCIPENGWDTTPSPKPLYGDSHTDFYFGLGNGTKMHFPQTWQESWDEFIGGMLSDSHAPDDTQPAFPKFVSSVRRIFDEFNDKGYIHANGGTDLVLGRLRKEVS
jgi:ubiquinone/menaquinone biosynthesis C-methylase UbiE